jgi:APA family basic amino acid/polyamine antiporter
MSSPEELAKAAGRTVFRRSASGLMRQFTAYDVLVYNIAWSMLLIDGAAYVYLWGPFAFPGANLPLGMLVVTLWATPQFIAYAMLASTMPRSGGDYVWQSRILQGWVGFVTMMVMAFSLFIWVALNGVWVTAFSSSPMLAILGTQLNNPGMVNLGIWLSSPNGIFAGTIVVNVVTFFMFLPGITPGLKSGRYGFWLVVLGIAALTVQLSFYSHADFVTQYNVFMAKLDPTHTNYYQYIIDTASSGGFSPNTNFNWFDTLGLMPLAWIVLAWPMWIFLNLGEVKGAESLKRMSMLTLGSLWICGIFMILWGYEIVNLAGWTFLSSAGYDWFNGAIAFPVIPWFMNLAAMMGSNPIPGLLIGLGAMAIGLWECWVNYVGGSRIMLAASLDRALPEWFGRIGRRFRQLVNVGIVYLVMGLIIGYFYDCPTIMGYSCPLPTFFTYTPYTSLAASVFQWFTMLAAVVFPFRAHMKDVWRVSPASKYLLAGIPIISIGGVVGMSLQTIMIWYELTVTNLGINSQPSLIAFSALLVGLFVYWWLNYGYWKRKGLDLSLAYKEVPPL